MVGQTISHYRILEKLGEGGMGVVYKAEDTKLERPVALKFLAAHAVEDPEHKARFIREAKGAARLDHQNICPVYEIDEAEGQTFLAMAYIEGLTVKDKIAERPRKLGEALDIAIQTAQGIEAAHEKGVIHRDIKSANLMVTPHGQVKIMDFGLAQLADRSKLTKTTTLLGTPAYMSPEQALRQPTDHRTDIWSLGVVLYEMVTGRLPFEGEREQAVLYGIANEEHEPPTALRSGLPVELDRIVGKALAKDPKERYQHADELLVDLRALQNKPQTKVSHSAQAVPLQRRRGWHAALAVIAIGLLAAVGAWRGWFRSTVPPSQTAFQAIPFTSYPGSEQSPSFSPDGRQVAFAWDGPDQDNFDIYVQLVGPGEPLRLTSDPAADQAPAWSPDGRWIAFVRTSSPNDGEVRIIPALGGSERRLTETSFLVTWKPYLAWTADSRWLVAPQVASSGEAPGMYLFSIETGEKRLLLPPAPNDSVDYYPAISPDGRNLAFSRDFRDIFVVPLSVQLTPEALPKRLTFDESQRLKLGPCWSPDGRDVVYWVFGANSRLWRVPASGSGTEQPLAGLEEGTRTPALSLQGNRLAFARHLSDPNIWRAEVRSEGRAASPPVKLIASTYMDSSAQYSPDGGKIAFVSDRTGDREIWVVNSDGASPVQLTNMDGSAGTPHWSPDGTRIAFDSFGAEGAGIYVTGAEGGQSRRVTDPSYHAAVPGWSRDGNWIYFYSNRGGTIQLWKVPSDGGEALQVTKNGGRQGLESLDGKFLYFVKDEGVSSLWKVPVEGGPETHVLDAVQSHRFAVSHDGIYFHHLEQPDRAASGSIRFYSFATGAVRTIIEVDKPLSTGISVSPDERWVIYSQDDRPGSDLMLVEGFH